MVSADPKRDIVFRYPEKGKSIVGLVFRFRGKTRTKAVRSVVLERSSPP